MLNSSIVILAAGVLNKSSVALAGASPAGFAPSLKLKSNAFEAMSAVSGTTTAKSLPDGIPHRAVTILAALSNLGLKPPSPGKEPGVRHMADVLRKHGLVERLQAKDAGTIRPPAYRPSLDPSIKIRNVAAIREYSVWLADRLKPLIATRGFPVVIGGDCSILLGSALALRRRGRYGLLFIDGHSDLLTPETSQTGGAAGMDLALATGTGPKLLTKMEGFSPLIQSADVVLFGYRWPTSADDSLATPRSPMIAKSLERTRVQGIERAAAEAVSHLEGIGLGFWIHVDLDVLSPEWMSAVDSPEPGGMSPTELATVLRRAVDSKRCFGMELTIYDPERDPTGRGAELIVDLLTEVFQPA